MLAQKQLPKRTLRTVSPGMSVLSSEQEERQFDFPQSSDSEEEFEQIAFERPASVMRQSPVELGRMDAKTRDAKIVELSKKTRQLNVKYEKERTKNQQLLQHVKQLEEQLQQQPVQVKPKDDSKLARDKLQQTVRKLEEERMHSQKLQREIQQMQKLLSKEIGQDFDWTKYQQDGSGWKSRQEQISILKEKVKELKARLDNRSHSAIEPRQRDAIEKLETGKRQEIIKLQQELGELAGKYQSVKTKLDASQARVKVLEKEQKETKTKMLHLVSKSDSDDQLIQALQDELKKRNGTGEMVFENLKQVCSEQQRVIQEYESNKPSKRTEMLQHELQHLRLENAQQQQLIADLQAKHTDRKRRVMSEDSLQEKLDLCEDENRSLKLMLDAALQQSMQHKKTLDEFKSKFT